MPMTLDSRCTTANFLEGSAGFQPSLYDKAVGNWNGAAFRKYGFQPAGCQIPGWFSRFSRPIALAYCPNLCRLR
jgi:hypothetical protein